MKCITNSDEETKYLYKSNVSCVRIYTLKICYEKSRQHGSDKTRKIFYLFYFYLLADLVESRDACDDDNEFHTQMLLSPGI